MSDGREVIDITDWFEAPEVIDLTDVRAPASPDRELLREKEGRASAPKRDTTTPYWDGGKVMASESHIDFRSIDRMSRHAQDKLAAMLKGPARTRIIRQIVEQTLRQVREGRKPSELSFAHDEVLEKAVATHVQVVYQQARQQAKAEVNRQVAQRRSDAAIHL